LARVVPTLRAGRDTATDTLSNRVDQMRIWSPLRSTRIFVSMPIYAFECAACGHEFDRLQKLSDADPTDCPACAQPQLKRQLTAPQFRLAGTGWYETDFKKDGEKKRNLVGGDGAGKPSESKSDAAAASKPAEAKSEPNPAA
jgi:putative FmdB family regulatory protein